jgi:hypothetical protein
MAPALRALVLTAAMLLLASGTSGAQCSGGRPSKFQSVTVTPINLPFGTASAAEFNAGWAQASYSVSVDPQTGQRWYFCVSTLDMNMGLVNGYAKPLSDLQWSLDGSSWTSFTTGVQQPITNNSGERTFTLFIRARLQYADDVPQSNLTPGTYSANLTFIVSM